MDLQIFKNNEFGEIRTTTINNEPWFVGKDVAEALGYQNASKALTDHVDIEDKLNNVSLSSLGQRGGWFINESGMYSLILSSKLESAKKFKRWITSEVIPSIRKNGGYIAGQETLSDEELLSKALLVAQNKIAEKDKQIEVMKPKADYFDALVDRHLLTNVSDTATELGIEERKFSKWLIDKGFCYRNSDKELRPHSDYKNTESGKGLFEVKDYIKNGHSGQHMLITPRGKETFRMLIESERFKQMDLMSLFIF